MSRGLDAPIKPLESSLPWQLARVLSLMASERKVSRRAVYNKLGRPRQTVDNWFRGRVLPRLEDFPAIDKALGFPRGELLIRSGFVDCEAAAKHWMATTDQIDEAYRPFVLLVVNDALKASGHAVPEQQKLVS